MNNQPAFPQHEYREFVKNEGAEGMSLRDYFAAKALQGIISNEGGAGHRELDVLEKDARRAYAYADAMIQARIPKGTGSLSDEIDD